MREFKNTVSITGLLTEMNLATESRDGKPYIKDGNPFITGDVVVKTEDGSQHRVSFFSYKFKRGSNGNITDEKSAIYAGYETVIDEYKDVKRFKEDADYVTLSNCRFSANDYFDSNKQRVIEYVNVGSLFIDRLTREGYDELETKNKIAKFELEGVVKEVDEETNSTGELTGKLKISLDVIGQKVNYKDKTAEPREIFTVKLTVMEDMKQVFLSAGYDVGDFVKLSGNLINTIEEVEVVEKQAFGEDLVKVFKNSIRYYKVTSGGSAQSIYDDGIDLTDEIIEQLQNARNEKLKNLKNGVSKSNNTASGSTANPVPNNPFAKKA